MERLNFMDWLTSILSAIAGIQLALVGMFNYNLLSAIFTNDTWYRVIVSIVSLAVLYLVGDVWLRVVDYERQHAHA